LRGAAEVAARSSVETALNELADQMESAYIQDWEPEVGPPARQPQAFDFENYVDTAADELRILSDPLSRRYASIARDVAAQHSPLVDPVGYANALRAASADVPHLTLIRELNRLADQVEATAPPAAPTAREPMMTTAIADIIDTISNAVGENTTPGVGNRVGTIAYRIAQAVDARTDPVAYANALRGYGTANEHVAVASGLRGIADLIEERARDAEPAPMAFRTPSQAEASAIMGGIETEFDMQIDALRNDVSDNAVRLFSRTFETLLRERGLTDVTIDNLPELGRALDGLRTDIAAQIASARTTGFEGVAVAEALLNMSLAVQDRLEDLEPARQLRAADLDNIRNERMIQVEDMLNDPDLDPDDLRATAFAMSGMGNRHWAPLAETDRRSLSNQLYQRANYIEFNPRDFAQRLMNEEGPEHYDDAITLLENNDYDHEILRGLPATERARSAQATALEMGRLALNEAYRQLNPTGVPPEPAVTPRQQAIRARVPQITDMLIDFSVDDPIATAADYRRVANILRDPRNAREFLETVMGVGDSLGDFTLRTTDLQSSTLRLIADELEHRAENWVAPADDANIGRAEDLRDAAEDLVNGLNEAYYTETPNARAAVRLMRQHLRALRRNGEMAYEDIFGMATTAYEWSPALLTALEIELENLIERYQNMDDYANGGPVRGYQAGGSVKKPDIPTPWLFSVPTYSETVAYEMYPGQKGQDDQRDAARHMLAAGTLSRKYGPKTAEFLGKAHEFTTSPLQAVKSMFTGKMPADYGMDTHNNRIGAQLGQRAKSQAELEDLVQAEAERASRTQTPDKAFIKKANGGIVQQNPTTDHMRYALMMRRK
jgi:hypothetical protein